NVRGREPQGIVDASKVPEIRRRLELALANIPGPDGAKLVVKILHPRTTYAAVRGDAPDLILYFDDLVWRSAGTLGHPTLFLDENDTGPDDAVHSWNGVFLFHDPTDPTERSLSTQAIRDVTPTLLSYLGLEIPAHVQGRP